MIVLRRSLSASADKGFFSGPVVWSLRVSLGPALSPFLFFVLDQFFR